jgi:hypothetical protein
MYNERSKIHCAKESCGKNENENEKTMKRKTLLKKRKEESFAKICCRCELRIKEGEHALGGGYDGVVCLRHRSCMSCWFDETARGARKHETKETQFIGLVNKPFKGTTPLCPGCKKGLPAYEMIKPSKFTVGYSGVISIEDSDTE